MKPPRDGMGLSDYVRELCDRHTHAEHYTTREQQTWVGRNHYSTAPPLVTQLWAGDVPSAAVDDGPRSAYGSKPTARLDALDTAAAIDRAASRWVRLLGHDDPADEIDKRTGLPKVGTGTIRCIRLVAAIAQLEGPETRREIERDVRRWWIRARVVTGWDSPAWEPDATCPMCGKRGTIRVRLADRVAACGNDACGATWEPETIGLLADHIRGEAEEARRRTPGRGPCWCPYPEPVLPDLRFMCPRCASPRCWHALQARLLADLAEHEKDPATGERIDA